MAGLDDIPHILNVACLRCPDLQTVRLVSPRNCVDIFLHLCAVKFERLQVLDISGTGAGDNSLHVLGMYCNVLRELNVRGCEKITDAGIEGLCVSATRLGKEDYPSGQCKAIETLLISGTRITKNGVQSALMNFPLLKRLPTDYCHAVPLQFLAEIHQRDWNSKRLKDMRKYSLDSLYLGDFLLNDATYYAIPYASGSLELAAALCPSATCVKVELQTGVTDGELLGLLSIQNVYDLEIMYANETVTFEGGVLPLLKAFGQSLKKLLLCHLGDVNLCASIDFCPKLRSLRLDENESYTTSVSASEDAEPYHYSKRRRMEKRPSVLKNLKKLRFFVVASTRCHRLLQLQ